MKTNKLAKVAIALITIISMGGGVNYSDFHRGGVQPK